MATRRDVIKMGSLAAVVGVVPGLAGKAFASVPKGLFEIPASLKSDSFYTGKNFEPFLNDVFSVSHKNVKHPVSLRLVEVQDKVYRSHTALGIRTKSCSLLFEGAKGGKLWQDIYEFKHKHLGKFPALLVPITKEGNCYQVVFNRI